MKKTVNSDEELDDYNQFMVILKKSLLTLDNLIKNNKIEIPVSQRVLLDISVGALAESQASGEVDLIQIFVQQREFVFDNLFFEEGGEYNLHDVLAQVICFRLIGLLEEYLEESGVLFSEEFENLDENPET